MNKIINVLQEWSIPLIGGVFAALIFANVDQGLYTVLVHDPIYDWPEKIQAYFDGTYDPVEAHSHGAHGEAEHGDAHSQAALDDPAHGEAPSDPEHAAHPPDTDDHAKHEGIDWAHYLTMHFLINDIFMVFFFGIAMKEIVEAILPGGALNPPSKAVNPLLGTIGGVIGPVGVYLGLNAVMGQPEWASGWGIPTATDIALAWLVARFVFGAKHPAVSFLLLLAVADDAIGLGIIAIFYPSDAPVWVNTVWIIPGMIVAYALRRGGVKNWVPYVFFGGALSWWGLYSANLHPALALVPIVPFLPAGRKDTGMFEEEADYEKHHAHSPLENFEHNLKMFVDFGLFFFAFANAGVSLAGINNLTWIVFLSLLVGKIIGITGFSWVGAKVGFPLPTGMGVKHLFTAAMVAAIGLTVALFVAGQAFEGATQGSAKMGAMFSGAICIFAIITGGILKVKAPEKKDVES